MRRRSGPETDAVIDKKIAEGRGKGEGRFYKPWIRVGEFKSNGEQEIIQGLKTFRDHHYFSEGESKHHLLAEFSPHVIDIREQYPLLPLEMSLHIAKRAGLKHPSMYGHPKVLTVDFLLTVKHDDSDRLLARSIKRSADLNVPRVREKQQLEALVCRAQGYPFEIVTEKELTSRMCLNLKFLRRWTLLERVPPTSEVVAAFLNSLSAKDCAEPVGTILSEIASDLNISRSLSVWLFQYLGWHHMIKLDIFSPIILTKPHLALRANTRK